MAKKKRVARKKSSVKKASSKKVHSKKSPLKSSINSPAPKIRNVESRLKRSNNALIYSLITFAISLVIYLATSGFLASLFGLILIIAGALAILFAITSIILYAIKKR